MTEKYRRKKSGCDVTLGFLFVTKGHKLNQLICNLRIQPEEQPEGET